MLRSNSVDRQRSGTLTCWSAPPKIPDMPRKRTEHLQFLPLGKLSLCSGPCANAYSTIASLYGVAVHASHVTRTSGKAL